MRSWFTANHDENSWNGTEYEKYGDLAKSLAVFSCTWNGIPLVYSGQELPNKKRLKFFEKDTIEWTGNNELHEFYRTLLALHSNNPAAAAGDTSVTTYRIKTNDDSRFFSYLRKKGNREVLVILNLSSETSTDFHFRDEKIRGVFWEVFTNSEFG